MLDAGLSPASSISFLVSGRRYDDMNDSVEDFVGLSYYSFCGYPLLLK
jgi:hypothetical protein